MSINQSIQVDDKNAVIAAEKLGVSDAQNNDAAQANQAPAIQPETEQEGGDYAGRKYQPDIDAGRPDSVETDEVFSDPRDDAGLPPAGQNAGEINIHGTQTSSNNDI